MITNKYRKLKNDGITGLIRILYCNFDPQRHFTQKLLELADDIEVKKDKKQMTTETTNIILDFINFNLEFAKILEQKIELMIFQINLI